MKFCSRSNVGAIAHRAAGGGAELGHAERANLEPAAWLRLNLGAMDRFFTDGALHYGCCRSAGGSDL